MSLDNKLSFSGYQLTVTDMSQNAAFSRYNAKEWTSFRSPSRPQGVRRASCETSRNWPPQDPFRQFWLPVSASPWVLQSSKRTPQTPPRTRNGGTRYNSDRRNIASSISGSGTSYQIGRQRRRGTTYPESVPPCARTGFLSLHGHHGNAGKKRRNATRGTSHLVPLRTARSWPANTRRANLKYPARSLLCPRSTRPSLGQNRRIPQ